MLVEMGKKARLAAHQLALASNEIKSAALLKLQTG